LGKQQEVEQFFRTPEKQNFHFCYINNIRHYIVNCVESLFNNTNIGTMFVNNTIFVVHPAHEFCAPSTKDTNVPTDNKLSVVDYIKSLYPKQKFLPLFFEILTKHNCIDENFYLNDFPNIHVTDLCVFLNNKFLKEKKIDQRFLKMCKWFQSQNIRFPNSSIKNPYAQKYLC